MRAATAVVGLDRPRAPDRRTNRSTDERFQDIYVSAHRARRDRQREVVWTRTTDQRLSRVEPGAKPLHLVGGVFSARLSPGHEATLFIGRRRGGLSCTAGTCYEVQAFEGAELRLVSRF
jgi:hypothetical protein